jgi:hypothetical protein
MTPTDILSRYDREARRRTDGMAPGFHVEWDGPVLRMTGPDATPSANAVLFAQLDEASADEAIARQVAFFATAGRSFEWKHFSHDRPLDLPARLTAAGFEAAAPESFVALDLSQEIVPPVANGIEIRRLEDPAAFDAITAVNGAVYGDADHASWLARVIRDEKRADPDGISVYAAFADEAPVSVGWMRYRRGDAFGSLWGGATLAEYRGRHRPGCREGQGSSAARRPLADRGLQRDEPADPRTARFQTIGGDHALHLVEPGVTFSEHRPSNRRGGTCTDRRENLLEGCRLGDDGSKHLDEVTGPHRLGRKPPGRR